MEKEKLLKDVQEYLRQNRGNVSAVSDEERYEKGEKKLNDLLSVLPKKSLDESFKELRSYVKGSEVQRNKLIEYCYEITSHDAYASNMSGPYGGAEAETDDGFCFYREIPGNAHKISVMEATRLLKEAMEFVRKHRRDPQPGDVILDIMDRHNMKPSDVYGGAELSRQAFSKITAVNSKVAPKKTTLWCIIIGLRCNITEADEILKSGGYIRSSEQDRVLEYIINSEIYDIMTINYILDGMGLPLLSSLESSDRSGKSGF